ncbi:bifunctional nitrilase/nitrile hydratase NIT4B-like [Quercus suber]|uniref:bifunctional nitrilase/nitrile hydratase NIT4B-like n=1 Tax=Quercus suber TaxID=58331 RepID=UPI0032DEB0B5
MAMIEAIKEAIWTPAKERAAVLCNNRRGEKLLCFRFWTYSQSKEIWQASMSHVNLEGGCFVLTANQFCKREDNLLGIHPYVLDKIICATVSVIISPSGQVHYVMAGPNYQWESISADLDKNLYLQVVNLWELAKSEMYWHLFIIDGLIHFVSPI